MISIRNRVVLAFAFLIVCVCINAAGVCRAESTAIEYKLKAAFMLNFAKFTTWPQDSLIQSEKNFAFCILGTDPFGKALAGLESKKVGGKKVDVHYRSSLNDFQGCQVLFISRSLTGSFPQLQKKIAAQPILTVSDIEGFSRMGGMFEFITKNEKLSFIVNNQEAQQSGLQVNASLLSLAAEVF